MFDKARLLDIIKNFICFSKDDKGELTKILAAYHQYVAGKKAVESTVNATTTDGKGGVFWHTQGSGKSLSMVFYAHLLQEALESPTIVVMTDRNDLDDQLFGQFARCADFLRQTPKQATCRKLSEDYKQRHNDNPGLPETEIGLKDFLNNRVANGIIFTTMQKFEESDDALSERRNIIVMADEAHRGQYGLEEKVDPKTGRIIVGTARIIRDSLPNATYIGFTGTPISAKDRSTIEIFGNYIDVYDMTQAVEDGATRPVFYESRVIHLKLDDDVLHLIDAEYDLMANNAEPYAIEKSKKELGQMESILGADQTLTALCEDIIKHYEENRQFELTGKAMVVAYSRPIAMKIYEKLLALRPKWKEDENVRVIMTDSNKDPEEWRSIIGNKGYRGKLAKRFKNPYSQAIKQGM
jgi:type I restriction enzyme R subunit